MINKNFINFLHKTQTIFNINLNYAFALHAIVDFVNDIILNDVPLIYLESNNTKFAGNFISQYN